MWWYQLFGGGANFMVLWESRIIWCGLYTGVNVIIINICIWFGYGDYLGWYLQRGDVSGFWFISFLGGLSVVVWWGQCIRYVVYTNHMVIHKKLLGETQRFLFMVKLVDILLWVSVYWEILHPLNHIGLCGQLHRGFFEKPLLQ